jgi:hypothetical protein
MDMGDRFGNYNQTLFDYRKYAKDNKPTGGISKSSTETSKPDINNWTKKQDKKKTSSDDDDLSFEEDMNDNSFKPVKETAKPSFISFVKKTTNKPKEDTAETSKDSNISFNN